MAAASQWSPEEHALRLARNRIVEDKERVRLLIQGPDLTTGQRAAFANGLAALVNAFLNMAHNALSDPALQAPNCYNHTGVKIKYLKRLWRYVYKLASDLSKGVPRLTAEDWQGYRLLAEFFWTLHSVPEYLVRANVEGLAERVGFTGQQVIGMDRLLWLADGWVKRTAGIGGHAAVISSRVAHALTVCEKEGFLSLEEIWVDPAAKLEEQNQHAAESFCMQIRRPKGWAVDLLKEVDVAVDTQANGGAALGKGRNKVTCFNSRRRVTQRSGQASAIVPDASASALLGVSEPEGGEGRAENEDGEGRKRQAMPEEEVRSKSRARVQPRDPFESLVEDLAEEHEEVEAKPRGGALEPLENDTGQLSSRNQHPLIELASSS